MLLGIQALAGKLNSNVPVSDTAAAIKKSATKVPPPAVNLSRT